MKTQTFEEKWQDYEKMCFSGAMPPARRREHKRCFYMGAFVSLMFLNAAKNEFNPEQMSRLIQAFHDEVKSWIESEIELESSHQN
jgi:hypothetical protein